MPELAQKRIDFIAHLHEVFLINKGYGALAYISLTEVMDLFNRYMDSGEPEDQFINRYVRSI